MEIDNDSQIFKTNNSYSEGFNLHPEKHMDSKLIETPSIVNLKEEETPPPHPHSPGSDKIMRSTDALSPKFPLQE